MNGMAENYNICKLKCAYYPRKVFAASHTLVTEEFPFFLQGTGTIEARRRH